MIRRKQNDRIMSTKSITFRLIAYSEAAGKYNPDAPREGNEDNFYIDDDLSDDKSGNCQPDKIVTMSDCGCLMVVADGMGGMNAGEVASEIAIKTVEEHFAPGRITPKIANSKEERKSYLERVIKEADRNVKLDARNNPEHKGMGSTIILAWIVGDHATVSWCGDSRAYRFNPVNGIEPLSRDHSYVQELVNRGEISYEATFDHPQNNIVTRSLGDPNNAAHPETRDFELYNGDIILVCSDGLSGVLRDKRTLLPDNSGNYYPGENIEDIIRGHQNSMIECKNALMKAAENADWYDNVTVLLCQILSGAAEPIKRQVPVKSVDSAIHEDTDQFKKILTIVAIVILLIFFGCGCYMLGVRSSIKKGNTPDSALSDTAKNDEHASDVQEVSAEICGEDMDQGVSSVREEEKQASGGNTQPKKVATDNDINDQTTHEGELTQTNWKEDLIKELKGNFTQELLREVVKDAKEQIIKSDDRNAMKALLERIAIRAQMLEKLRPYANISLTKKGQDIFEKVQSEIANPKIYNPPFWESQISSLANEKL